MTAARGASAFLLALGSLGGLALASTGADLAAILLVIGTFLLHFVWEVRERGQGVIHLDLCFLAFFLAYALCVPIYAELGAKDLSRAIVSHALVICLLCVMGYALGTLVAVPQPAARASGHRPMRAAPPAPEAAVRAGYIVFAVGLALSVLAILLTVGFNAYLSAGYAGRALLKRDNGPIELGLYVCVSAIIAIFSGNALSSARSARSNLFVAAAILLFIGYTAFLGIRRPMFLLIMGLFASHSLIFRRPSLAVTAATLLPLVLLLATFAQYRQIISSAGVSEAVTFVQDNANADWLDLSKNELGAPFRTLYDTIGNEGAAGPRQYGLSYLIAPLYILPSILGLKVQSLSVQYTNRFFDQRFLDIGGNMGYFPATEAYVNFGYPGCVVIFALYAVLLGRLNGFFHARRTTSAILVTMFAVLVPWMAFFIRLDFASFMKGFFYSQLSSVLLIHFVAARMSASPGKPA